MQVQVHADSSVKSNAILAQTVEEAVGNAVRRWTPRITRVEVHLSDINGQKGGADDKRCLLEARIGGLQPIAVTHQAGTLYDAVEGAADKLKKVLQSTMEKLNDR